VLDELPSLEFAATAVALVLLWRALVLWRGGAGLLSRRRRVESARARDLIGLVILAGAALYAIRAQRASTWFLVASGIAVLAQLVGFYFRASTQARPSADAAAGPSIELDSSVDNNLDDGELLACPSCGHGTLIELEDTARLLGGLSQLTPVSAWVCPHCGALSGHVDDPANIPIGDEHGTSLRQSLSGEDQEALEEPAEHDG
jgi:YgiT-type zinc finger domain-containing protein